MKTYWKVILVVVALVIFGILTLTIFRSDFRKKIKQMLDLAEKNHQEQLQVIEHERKKKEELDKKTVLIYQNAKNKLLQQHSEQKTKLFKSEESKLKKMVKQYSQDPDELTKQIAQEFGLEYVQPK